MCNIDSVFAQRVCLEGGIAAGLARLEDLRGVVADVDVRPSAEGWSDLAQLIDLRAGLVLAVDNAMDSATEVVRKRIDALGTEIGRASCRERVFRVV